MGRGKRSTQPGAAVVRPDFDAFVRLSDVLGADLAAAVARPVRSAEERGVIGWCVSDDACLEILARRALPINVQDVPVPVATEAWRAGRLSQDNLFLVLQAHDQVMKPGDERVADDDDGHYQALCWCGFTGELCLTPEEAERELEGHGESHAR